MKEISLILLLAWPLALAGCGADKHHTAEGDVARAKPYVASAGRDPFHKPDCRWAAKIDTANLRGYDTREQAIADGHRPCKVCKP